METMQMIRSE